MKRWIPFLLIICVVLLLPAVSVSARAADTFGACGDNLTWTFDEATGTLTIEGTGPMWDWDSIDPPWHSHPIKSAVIRNGVTSIGIVAFSGCYSLSEVSIPDSVTSIGDYAFTCTSLTDITVDSNNPKYCSVDGVLFDKYKTRLIQYPTEKNASNYIIPDSTTFIGEHAFSNCDSLTEVTIPHSVTYIGDSAFEDCNSLTEVTIPDSVTYIGDRAFTYCLSLTDITVDNNNTHYCSVDGVLFDKSKTTPIPRRKRNQRLSHSQWCHNHR